VRVYGAKDLRQS